MNVGFYAGKPRSFWPQLQDVEVDDAIAKIDEAVIVDIDVCAGTGGRRTAPNRSQGPWNADNARTPPCSSSGPMNVT